MEITIANTTPEQKTVIILGREHHFPLQPSTVKEAWQILRVGGHGQSSFSYSANTSVGAYYTREDGLLVNIGPYPAKPGSSWVVTFASRDDSGSMTEEAKYSNSYGGYTIINKPLPSNTIWGGRKVNVALYNSEKILITKENLRVGDYAELKPSGHLYFCCMEVPTPTGLNIDIDGLFAQAGNRASISEEEPDFYDVEFSQLTRIDLNNFPNGLDIDLKENKTNGMLTFVPKPKFC